MATATALSATPHSVPTRILDQAGAKLLAGTALMAHPVMGRAGTAITTGQAAGVPTAEVIPGAALELSAISKEYQLGLVGVRLAPNPLFLDDFTEWMSKPGVNIS